jgi:tetratricopeptide (TPR) repeat protein
VEEDVIVSIKFWQQVSNWGVTTICAAAIVMALANFFVNRAQTKLKKVSEKKDDRRWEEQRINLSEIKTAINDGVNDLGHLIIGRDDSAGKTELDFRRVAFDQFKQEDYFDALQNAERAVKLGETNPRNYLVRGYIYTELYENFYPVAAGQTVVVKQADRWYEDAMNDYRKVVDLTEGKDTTLFIEAKVRIVSLLTIKPVYSFSFDRKKGDKYFNEATTAINDLLAKFPNDEKILTFSKLLDDSKSSYHKDWDSVVTVS